MMLPPEKQGVGVWVKRDIYTQLKSLFDAINMYYTPDGTYANMSFCELFNKINRPHEDN